MKLVDLLEKVVADIAGKIGDKAGPIMVLTWTDEDGKHSVDIPRDVLTNLARQQGCFLIHDGPHMYATWPDGMAMHAVRRDRTDEENALGADVWLG